MENNIKEIIDLLSNKVFVISDIMESKETFNDILETVYDYLKQGFEIKELRTCPTYFKFKEEGEIHVLQLRHFLTNLMFWEPLMRFDYSDKIDETYIVDCTKMSSKLIKNYIDNKIVIPYKRIIPNKKMNKVIHDMIYNLSRISRDFNIILGLSMNLETFIDVAKRNPRFNEIIRTQLDEDMQPTEIEAYLDKLMYEQMDILKNDEEGNLLKPILKSGAGIKSKQLAEFSISSGLNISPVYRRLCA